MANEKVSSKDRESTPLEITDWLNNQSKELGIFNPAFSGIEFTHPNDETPTHENRLIRHSSKGRIIHTEFVV